MRTAKYILVGIAIIFGIGFVANGLGLVQFKIFGPAWENARRDVYENTNSFTKAKRQEALNAMAQYKAAETNKEKNGIQSIIKMSLADFNEDKYVESNELKAFIKKMKYGALLPVPIGE